jgi:TrmH family RNA methyltransferase
VNLKNKKFRDQEGKFLVEGAHLIIEAQKKNLIVETISIVDTNADYFVTKEIMEKISEQKSISSNAAVVKFIPDEPLSGNVLILDGLQDPGNLGTIIRSGVAFGFTNFVLSKDSVDIYNSKVIRATEGMIFHVNVKRCDLKEFIPNLKMLGYNVIGTDVKKGTSIKEFKNKDIALIIGSEGEGMKEEIKDLCDNLVNIKMTDTTESLNAGVAASILMYEVYNG